MSEKGLGRLKAALFIIFLCGAAACDLKAGEVRNVLLITLDTTRADRIGCYGYAAAETPNLDALARGGVRFANAYSPVPLTLPSHCSILTGTSPLYHLVHNNGLYVLGSEIPTLAEILEKTGSETAAFVSSFTLDSRFGLDRGFRVYDDTFQEEEVLKSFRSERRAGDLVSAFLPWFDANYRKKFFCWLHFYDPHLPYNPPSPFKERFGNRKYDGEIAYMDHAIGKVLEKLKMAGILERTLIVVAGDHGEALGERQEIDHGMFLYDNTVKVPLILHAEGVLAKGKVVSARVRLMDILPTVLEMAGISIPKAIQGRSLLPWITGRRKDDLPCYIETYYPRENFGWSELKGLVDGSWKYILAPKSELYDLKNDPWEENNLFQREPALSKVMANKLLKMIREDSRSKPPDPRKSLPSEDVEKLRSLGYLGIGGGDVISDKDLPDPKDKISDYLLYFRGNLMENEGHFDKALECYREVLRLNPDVPSNHVNLGFLLMKMGSTDDAIGVLEDARERFPESTIVLSRLMGFYLRAERWDDAIATGLLILELKPKDFDALFLSGSARAKRAEWAEALSLYRQALEIEPENKVLRHRYAYALAAVGRNEEALHSYYQLKKEYANDHVYDMDIAIIYESMGQMKMAREVLKDAVERFPSPDTYYAYAMVLGKSGDSRGAIQWIKAFLKSTPEKDTRRKAQARAALSLWEASIKTP